MSELFISYSRRDKDFVRRLIKGLNEQGYSSDDIWVDWEDIPASSKWEDEIHKGIRETNAVVFVLSPEWAISSECAKELAIAVENNKRLFPIIWQDVAPNTIQKDLASLNWIFFREIDDFDEAIQKLLAALNTDLEWVAQHTKLLRRANEWEGRKRDSGYLLRGAELQAAEAWFSLATEEKQPRPTPLQNEYIFASRQDAVRRQRRNMIWAVATAAVSILLAIAAVISGVTALRQSQRALASELAAQSTDLVSTQPDLSLLLSIESNFIGDELGEDDAARLGSLATSLNSSPRLETYLRPQEDTIRAMDFSPPDGRWLATTGNPNGDTAKIFLWDMTVSQSPTPHYQVFNSGKERLLAVKFSPDGTRFAAAGDEGKIYLFDPGHCCAPVSESSTGGRIRALDFVTINGSEYVVAAADQQVIFWDYAGNTINKSLSLNIPAGDTDTRILSLTVSPDQSMLAVGSEDGNITVWDLKTRKIKIHECAYGDPSVNPLGTCEESGNGNTDVRAVAFTLDGKYLLTGGSDQRLWLWDFETGKPLAKSASSNEGGHINSITSISVSPQNGQIATSSWDNTVRVWELQLKDDWWFNRVDTLIGHSNSVWTTAYSPDGERLASGSSDKTVILWSVNQISQIGTRLAKMEGEVWALAKSPNGDQFAAGDEAGNIRIWTVINGQPEDFKTLKHDQGVLTLAYSNDGRWLASAGYDKNIRVWNAQTGEEVWTIEGAHDDQIWWLMFNPNDSILASVSFDKTTKLWDTSSYAFIGKPLEHDKSVYTLTFNRDGTQLLVAGYELDIYLWDVTNPASVPSPSLLKGHKAAVNILAFNPVYPNIFASTSDDKTLLLWNIPTREHTNPVSGLNESMEAVTFTPNGKRMASATNNRTVLLWQWNAEVCATNWVVGVCQPERIGKPLTGHHAPVQNVIYLTDTLLVSSDEDGQLILWDLDKSNWYDYACAIVNRQLTEDEYEQYIGDKLNLNWLNIFSWFTNLFGTAPDIEPPDCIKRP